MVQTTGRNSGTEAMTAGGSTRRIRKETRCSLFSRAAHLSFRNLLGQLRTASSMWGYLVHSRDAEDRFYRGVLGFRRYWFGAMQPDHVDWISQQVPNGHDWLE
jgi:hypothetical protein